MKRIIYSLEKTLATYVCNNLQLTARFRHQVATQRQRHMWRHFPGCHPRGSRRHSWRARRLGSACRCCLDVRGWCSTGCRSWLCVREECRWKRTERNGPQSKGTRENTPDEKVTSEMAPTHTITKRHRRWSNRWSHKFEHVKQKNVNSLELKIVDSLLVYIINREAINDGAY